MQLQDGPAARGVGLVDRDVPVEAARAQEGRVQDVGAVRCPDHDKAGADLEPVHLHQHLVQRLLAFVRAAALAVASFAARRIELVDEDDRRCHRAHASEEIAHSRRSDTDERLHELGAGYGEEGDPGLTRNGLGQKRLPASGGAEQEHALRRHRADLVVTLRVREVIDHLFELDHGFLGSTDVGEGGGARLAALLALLVHRAEGHDLADRGASALACREQESEEAREDQQRQEVGRNRPHDRLRRLRVDRHRRTGRRHDLGEHAERRVARRVGQPVRALSRGGHGWLFLGRGAVTSARSLPADFARFPGSLSVASLGGPTLAVFALRLFGVGLLGLQRCGDVCPYQVIVFVAELRRFDPPLVRQRAQLVDRDLGPLGLRGEVPKRGREGAEQKEHDDDQNNGRPATGRLALRRVPPPAAQVPLLVSLLHGGERVRSRRGRGPLSHQLRPPSRCWSQKATACAPTIELVEGPDPALHPRSLLGPVAAFSALPRRPAAGTPPRGRLLGSARSGRSGLAATRLGRRRYAPLAGRPGPGHPRSRSGRR